MAQITDMQFAVAQFGAANRVIADDTGIGSYYVAIPKVNNSQLMTGGDANTHPAFIVNGVEKDEILIGKYHAFVKNNRAYSLPGMVPNAYVNFDQCVTFCKNKGNGHHLITNAEYALLALWTKMNNTMPRGNTSYGASSDMPSEVGIPAAKGSDGATWSTKTGASFPAWYHNGDLSGIDGICGNLWHWCGGMRLNNGKIQVLANNDAAMLNADMGATSAAWKEILESNGSLVAPGTAGTLGYDWLASKITLTAGSITDTSGSQRSTAFEATGLDTSVSPVPQTAKSLALFPNDASGYLSDNFWATLQGERMPLRGGSFFYGASAGVFALYLNSARADSDCRIGFRVAFCNL